MVCQGWADGTWNDTHCNTRVSACCLFCYTPLATAATSSTHLGSNSQHCKVASMLDYGLHKLLPPGLLCCAAGVGILQGRRVHGHPTAERRLWDAALLPPAL